MRLRGLALVLALVSGLAPAEVMAGADERSVFTIQGENDRVAATDRHYTQGLRLSWLSGERDFPAWTDGILRWGDLFDTRQTRAPIQRFGLALGQSIFTPEDVRSKAVVLNDRPYAGWLYIGLSAHTAVKDANGDPVRLDTVELDLGVVGPAAFAGVVQNNFHDLINSVRSRGWQNQLRNEPGVILAAERRWRMPIAAQSRAAGRNRNVLGVDLLPHIGGSAGNVLTYAGIGATIRFGVDLFKDFGPPHIRPNLPGSRFFSVDNGFGWYVFAGVEGRAVLRNIFLDGNTFRDSHSVDKRTFVGDAQTGIAVVFPGVRITYTHVFRTREFEGQRRADRFGAVSLSVRF